MAENFMPTPNHRSAAAPGPELPATKDAPLVYLEEYRLQHERRKIIHRLGDAALELSGQDTLSCVPIDIYEYPGGDITIKFAAYSARFKPDDYSVSHPGGWSGGPESKRIIVSHYDSASGQVDAATLHPRNLIYVQSDIRAKQRTGEHEHRMHRLYEDLI